MMRRALWPAVLWTLLVTVLALVAWFLMLANGDDFRHELGAAALGSAFNAATAMVIAFVGFWTVQRLRQRQKAYSKLRSESVRRRSVVVGDLRIEHVILVAVHSKEQGSRKVLFEFAPLDPRPERIPPGWEALRDDRLNDLRQKARKDRIMFVNGSAVDLRDAAIVQSQRNSIDGVTKYRLVPGDMQYHLWAATSARLDLPLSSAEMRAVPGSGSTLREKWNRNPSRLEDVADLPSPAKVGCGVVVVTSDGQMVMSARGKTFIASRFDSEDERLRSPLHFIAEGMSPEDIGEDGLIDPRVTALRGLEEELGISPSGGLAQVQELTQTGMFFDVKRWQPCFAFLAKINLSFDELSTLAASAGDYWEADSFIPLPYDLDSAEVRSLLLGSHPDFVFASNHAQALAYLALLYEFGLTHMQGSMRRFRKSTPAIAKGV